MRGVGFRGRIFAFEIFEGSPPLMGGYPEEGMPLLATVDPVWLRCGSAEGSLPLYVWGPLGPC